MSAPHKERPVVQPSWLTAESGGEKETNGHGISASQTNTATSGGAEQSKGPSFKPKFVPKVPVKKETSALQPTESSSSATATDVTAPRSDGPKNGDRFGKKGGNPLVINKFTPRNKSVGFKDGPQTGTRKWVMPVGAAFFTGTNGVGSSSSASTAAASAAPSGSIKGPVALSTVLGSPAAGAARIARPNEQISQFQPKVPKVASHSSFSSYLAPAEPDSDAEDCDGEDDSEDPELAENEVWPPPEYDALAPLALPLGPRSQAMRNQLAAEPILANPLDRAALEKEESSSLFVLQMPTDLKFNKLKEQVPAGEDASRIRIGKMQLLKSGRVRLITLDGKSYEVNSGMASSFVQLLSSIQATEDANKSAASAALDAANGGSHGNNSNGTSSNSSSSSSNNNSGGAAGRAGVGATGRSIAAVAAAAAAAAAAKAAEPQATMNLMGSVTKKLVLTPSHDIGVRRPRGYSTAAASAAQKKNLPSELMHALGQQQYPEDEEVVGDV